MLEVAEPISSPALSVPRRAANRSPSASTRTIGRSGLHDGGAGPSHAPDAPTSPWRGTEGSNPPPSSRESVSRGTLSSWVKSPGFPRGCGGCVPGAVGRDPRGPADIAPTRGKISLRLYSSTAFSGDAVATSCRAKASRVSPNEIGLPLGSGMLVDLARSDLA